MFDCNSTMGICKFYSCICLLVSFVCLFENSKCKVLQHTINIELRVDSFLLFSTLVVIAIIIYIAGLISKWREDRTK